MKKYKRVRGLILGILIWGGFFVTSQVHADCWNGLPTTEPVPFGEEGCQNENPPLQGIYYSSGTAVYNCSTNYPGHTGENYCYAHPFMCTGTCGASGSGQCPTECRKTSCGTGYENASGCGKQDAGHPNSGCKSNQACCRPKNCNNCSNTAPDKPALSSPANGSSVSSTNVTLTWNLISGWGKACNGANN
jgi:hypothetical protein